MNIPQTLKLTAYIIIESPYPYCEEFDKRADAALLFPEAHQDVRGDSDCVEDPNDHGGGLPPEVVVPPATQKGQEIQYLK
jgi:hypothetical protein